MANFSSASTINALTSTLNAKLYLSEGYNVSYERKNFMGNTKSQKYGEADWVDPLDPRLIALLQGKVPYVEVVYTNQPITNISDTHYNTTTLWWLILMFNGYLHAHDIPDGVRLKVPSIQFIQNKLDTNKNVNRGKIVVF